MYGSHIPQEKKTTKPIHTHTARHETLCSLITTPLALCCLNEAKQCNLKIKNPTTVPRQIKRKYINYNEKKNLTESAKQN